MPHGSEGRKRLRMDSINPEHQVDPHSEHRNTPDWVRTIDTKSLQLISNIQRTLCKKENAVRKLETHMDHETIPSSMRIQMTIAVTAEKQSEMDAIVAEATKVFHKTVLDGLIKVRREEELLTKLELTKVTQNRIEEVDALFAMLEEEGLAPSAQEKQQWTTDFDKMQHTLIRDVRTKDFQERKLLIEKQLAQTASREERRMEIELQDPAMKILEAKVKQLEGLVKSKNKSPIAKKEQAKPDKPRSSGGQNKMGPKRNPKKKSKDTKPQKKDAAPTNGHGKTKGGGKESRNRRSA